MHGKLSYKHIEIQSGKARAVQEISRSERCACDNYALAASLGIVNSEFFFAGHIRSGFVNWGQNSFATIYLGQ